MFGVFRFRSEVDDTVRVGFITVGNGVCERAMKVTILTSY